MLIRSPRHVVTRQWSEDLTVVDGVLRDSPGRVGAGEVLGPGLYVLPGLVDSHTHLVTSPDLGERGYQEAVGGEAASIAIRIRAHLRLHLSRGVTLVRDAGAPRSDLHEMGLLGKQLPLLQTAGRFLASPRRYGANLANEVEGGELTEAAIASARGGQEWVKLIVDYPERGVPAASPSVGWSVPDVRSAVEAVHELGLRVIAHAMSPDGARLALDAGVDSLEHGCGATANDLAAMAQDGTAWTPTLAPFQRLLEMVRAGEVEFPEKFLARAVEATEALVPEAERAGVTTLCGTDGILDHGDVATEVAALVQAGATPGFAVRAATVEAWRYLVGVEPLADGAPADFVLLDRDPIEDLGALADPVLVVRGGQVVRRSSGISLGGFDG